MEKLQKKDVKAVPVSSKQGHESPICLMEGEIPDTAVYYNILHAHEDITLPPCENFVRILLLCKGDAVFKCVGSEYSYRERAVFTTNPVHTVGISTTSGAEILEIRWFIKNDEFNAIINENEKLPYSLAYSDASKYGEACKSDKTISRMLIPPRLIPRFAMGSVEAYGDDLISQHAHPHLEQYFFTLPENNSEALLDDITYPLGGNTLLHIPLGSNHGVRVTGKQVAHYIWMDFLFDESGLRLLEETHKPL